MNQKEEIYREMKGEDVGIWFISDEYGFKISAKIPSNVIRSLINGCQMEFLFGKDDKDDRNYFHTGSRIYDDSTNPVLITQPCRFIRDYEGLKRILNEKEVIIELYDELLTCSATAELTIEEEDRIAILQFMEEINEFYEGDYNADLSVSMDSFVYSLDPSQKTSNSYKIKTKSVLCEIKNWNIIHNHFIGFTDAQQVNISDKDEGGTFERQIWYSMESLFINDIYLNPVVKQESNDRELTDIFAHHEYGNFLVETKALGILSLDKEQTIERKVANVKKQILKAIKQLIGANKNIKRNLPVISKSGKEIKIDSSLIPHCIVLVSELIPFGDWEEIEKEIMLAMMNEKMYLHVMDYHEFMKYVKASMGSKERLDYHLIGRAESFVEHGGQIHMKTRFVKEEKK
jgi:hypothetical protein